MFTSVISDSIYYAFRQWPSLLMLQGIMVSLLYSYLCGAVYIEYSINTCSIVCSVVLHTLVPHKLHQRHTKCHVMGINLVYSLYLSSHVSDGAVTAGDQLPLMNNIR